MKKLFFLLLLSVLVVSLAGFASAQQRGYQGGQSGQYERQDQQGQYGMQDQYGRDQWGRQQERQPRTGFMGGRQQMMAGNFWSASDLMDKKVKSQTGEDLGNVDDFIITRNGQVAYLIVSHGGALGVGSKYIPIPFRNAQLSQQEDALILPNINKAALDNAPTISKNDWQRLEDPGFERQVFSYYGRQGQGMRQQQQQPSPQEQQRPMQQQQQPGGYPQGQQRPMQQQQSGQMGR